MELINILDRRMSVNSFYLYFYLFEGAWDEVGSKEMISLINKFYFIFLL